MSQNLAFSLLGSARQHLAVRTLVQGAGWDRGQMRAEMVEPQQAAAGAGDGGLPGLGAGQGTWANALAKQVSVLVYLLLLGFGLSSGLENKMPPPNSSEGKRGGGGMEAEP